MAGSYTLIVSLATPSRIRFGAAGARDCPAGAYAYTGSAFGPGGFARLDRHRDIARGERTVRHWHVDHLLRVSDARVVDDIRSPGARIECPVAERLLAHPVTTSIPRIGASDCDCSTHLVTASTIADLRRAAQQAHAAAVDAAATG